MNLINKSKIKNLISYLLNYINNFIKEDKFVNFFFNGKKHKNFYKEMFYFFKINIIVNLFLCLNHRILLNFTINVLKILGCISFSIYIVQIFFLVINNYIFYIINIKSNYYG